MPHEFKQLLEKIAREKAPGPSPTLSVFHLLLALELMSERTIGRGKLAQELDVGDGAVRTIAARLRDAGFVQVSKAGCSLTHKGLRIWKQCASVFKKVQVQVNDLNLARYNFAVLVRNHAYMVKAGVEQRDAAVVAGGKGAVTILSVKNRLLIPSVSDDMAKDFPVAAKELFALLMPAEGDVIVVGSAEERKKAEQAALAAAWTLVD
jgi:DNA-binding MarR family transcriptional regulator